MSLEKFANRIKLDEYTTPTFEIEVGGKVHVAQVNTFEDFQRLAKADVDFNNLVKEANEKGEDKPLESDRLLMQLAVIFPEIKRDYWAQLPVAKLSAVVRGAIDFMYSSLNYSLKEMGNFNRGKAKGNPAGQPENS